jgi:hypothetical protein
MEFGREVFGVPGNVTQPVSFTPNLLIKQGTKLVVNRGGCNRGAVDSSTGGAIKGRTA